jgi:hypothetical protein
VGFFSAKVFCARKMQRIFLIGHKKPSFTAGTLCAIIFEIVVVIFNELFKSLVLKSLTKVK